MDLEKEIKSILEVFKKEIIKELIEIQVNAKLEKFRHLKNMISQTAEFESNILKTEIETLSTSINDSDMIIYFDERFGNWELVAKWKMK